MDGGIPTWEIVSRQFLKISYLSIVIKKENDAYLIVTDYRAIKEQSSGQIYASSVQALVIKNKGKKGEEEMYLESIRNVSDTEFINDFTGELSNISMAKVFEAIDKDKVKEVSKDEISF